MARIGWRGHRVRFPPVFLHFSRKYQHSPTNNWKRALLSVPGVLFSWAFLNFALKMIFSNCHKIAFLIQKNRKSFNFFFFFKDNLVFAKMILFPNAKSYVFVLFWWFWGNLVQKFSVNSVAPAAYKNKLTVNRRRHLARVLSSLTCRCALFPNASDVSVSYMQPGLRQASQHVSQWSLTNFQVN